MNIKINHRLGVVDVTYFNEVKVSLKFDSLASTFATNFMFDEKNRLHAELACVSHYHECQVEHEGERLITGFILDENFTRFSKDDPTQFAGYSKPGVFEDCEIPPSLYPLQSDGLSIRQIAQKIISPFNIRMIVDSSVASIIDAAIPVTTGKENQNIKSYLTDLCAQRRVVITHNANGDIVFTRANTNKNPLFHVEDGIIASDIRLKFSGQSMHSNITILKDADDDGGNSGEYTINNPYVATVYRPKVINQTSGDDISVEDTALNALASELKSGINLEITVDRWKVNNKMILPNNMITVKSPKNFIYKESAFFIESVDLVGDSKKETAVLTCVLPEVYNGRIPKNIFVDPHENLPRI